MNDAEARTLLAKELEPIRQLGYSRLRSWITDAKIENFEIQSPSGTKYQIEVQALWDGRRGGNIRVIASIDDGGWWSCICPLCDDFIIAPDGRFVGE